MRTSENIGQPAWAEAAKCAVVMESPTVTRDVPGGFRPGLICRVAGESARAAHAGERPRLGLVSSTHVHVTERRLGCVWVFGVVVGANWPCVHVRDDWLCNTSKARVRTSDGYEAPREGGRGLMTVQKRLTFVARHD